MTTTTWKPVSALALTVWAAAGSLALGTPAQAAAQTGEYQLRYGDAITVQLVGQPDLAVVAQPIRPDGNVTLPLVREVKVAGKTVAQLTALLTGAYKPFVLSPSVTVNVARFRPTRITVLGQVGRPGNIEFQEAPRLVDVLAGAGGLTERAARDAIRVKEPGSRVQVYDLDTVLAGKVAMPIVSEDATIEVGEVWYPDMYRLIPIAASIITATAVLMR